MAPSHSSEPTSSDGSKDYSSRKSKRARKERTDFDSKEDFQFNPDEKGEKDSETVAQKDDEMRKDREDVDSSRIKRMSDAGNYERDRFKNRRAEDSDEKEKQQKRVEESEDEDEKDREKDRGREKHRGRDRDRNTEHLKGVDRKRDRGRDEERNIDREKNRERDDRDKEMDREKDRSGERDRERRVKETDRDRGKDRDRERDRGRDRGRDKYGERDRDRDRGREREREKEKHKGRDRSREKERERDRDRERRKDHSKKENVNKTSKSEEREEEKEGKSIRSRKNDKDSKEDAITVKSPPPQQKKVKEEENLGKTGGVYIPPFKLARMMQSMNDKSSAEYQRMTWDALRKSINGLVNKVNASNIKNIIPELFAENLIRGRGLFARSCMKSQMASPSFTHVFSAMVAVVNTKLPSLGLLLLKRIVLQFRRAYKRNDKTVLLSTTKFIAHLVNQQVVHELLALELLTLLLERPTDDSVEIAVGFVKDCGLTLQDFSPRGLQGIFERFRGILHEGEIDKRVQFMIEGLFAIRKAKFAGYESVLPNLDLVEQEDQITHEVALEESLDAETNLDIFKFDPEFEENERKFDEIKREILGEDYQESGSGEEGSDEEDEEEEEEEDEEEMQERMEIQDRTETNLVNLRRTIYLTIMASVDFEEAGHKLMKIKLDQGQEMELCVMLLECCSQERTYLRYYGLLGQRFCMINKVYQENFDTCFVRQYTMIHRLETNKLRNVAKFFAHLLCTDALPWGTLAYIRLTEDDTSSSSRIFIKILFQEMSEHLGLRVLNERLQDPSMESSFNGVFPKDSPKNTRFAINFFTSIGLGGLTDNLREYLKNMPKMIMQQQKQVESEEGESDSGSSDSESSESSDSESSDSESSDSGSESSDSGSSESESD